MNAQRKAMETRETQETRVAGELELDGEGVGEIQTGLPFLDHMLLALARHSGWNLRLRCAGDLDVDCHHTVEDCGLLLGRLLLKSLADKKGIVRFGSSYAPLDEALVRAVVDLSGRPFARVNLAFTREFIGNLATENIAHFFESFASSAGLTLHLDGLEGRNSHHLAEAAFKALALALRMAVAPSGLATVPSTKGVL